jgi:hypothetical protein
MTAIPLPRGWTKTARSGVVYAAAVRGEVATFDQVVTSSLAT